MTPCFYECGREANTNDHIIPVELGGANNRSNFVRACNKCNGLRGHKPIEVFAAEIGLDKPLPKGVSDIEWKLTQFDTSKLTIIACLWCERPKVTLRQPQNQAPKFCSKSHGLAYKRSGFRPRTYSYTK